MPKIYSNKTYKYKEKEKKREPYNVASCVIAKISSISNIHCKATYYSNNQDGKYHNII